MLSTERGADGDMPAPRRLSNEGPVPEPTVAHAGHADAPASWHVLEGTLHFRFADHEVDVAPGGSIFVPAGVPHTYTAMNARYLMVLTPRLAALISDLQHTSDRSMHPEMYRKYESALLE